MNTARTAPSAQAAPSVYRWTDGCGNTNTIYVHADGQVLMCNQHRISMSLSSVGFMISSATANGYVAKAAAVRTAARAGLATLRAVTQLDWKAA